MSSKSQIYPLSRTGKVAGTAGRTSWSLPLKFGKNKLIHSQLMYGTRSWPLGEADPRSEASRNHRDMILGLALAFSVSATFWTGVGLLVARILR